MDDSVGQVLLEIKVLRKELIEEAKSAAKEAAKEAQAEANRASKGFSKSIGGITSALGGLGSVVSTIGGIIGAAFSVAKIVSFGKACIDLGSDLAEVQNVVDVVYGSMSEDVNSFAQSAIKSFGMSETVAKNYMGTLGAMSKAFGFTTEEAYSQAEALTSLAGDMASFYNKSTDETFTALKAVYSGETEVLKQYGVVMNETALNEFALSQGMNKTVKEMSEQEKVSLRLAFVQDRLSAASGDFQRTSGGWANQVRVLSLQFDSFKASIGQGLINVLTPLVQWLNMVMEAANKAAQAFSNFTASIMNVAPEAGGFGGIADATAAAAEGADNLTSGITSAGGAAKKAMQKLAGFDRINTLSSESSGGGGGGGSAALATAEATADATSETADATNKWSDALSGVIKKATEIKDAFVEGFNASYGGSKYIDGIKSDVTSIGATAKKIFTDPDVQGAADGCAKSWAKALGSVSGTVATVALGATETVTGSIDQFMTENEGSIKDHLVTMFDLSSREGEAIASLSTSVSNIFQAVFDSGNLKSALAAIEGVFFDIHVVFTELEQAIQTGYLEGYAEGIKTFEKDISDALVNITDAINTFIQPFKENFDIVRKNFEASGIADKAKGVGKSISEIVGLITKSFNKLYPVIKPIIKLLGDRFGRDLGVIFAWLITIINVLLSALKGLFGYWKGAFEVLTGLITGDSDLIKKGFDDMLGAITGCINDILGDFEGFAQNVIEIFNPVITFIQELWGGLSAWFDENVIQPIIDYFKPVEDSVGNIFDSLWCVIVGIWVTAAEWFDKTVVQPAINFFRPIVDTVSGFFSDIWDDVVSVWNSAASWFDTNVIQPVTGFFEEVWTNVSGFFSSLWNDVCAVWQDASQWFNDNVITPIADAFGGIVDSVKSAFNSVLDTIESAINNILKGLNSFIDKLDEFGEKGAETLGQSYTSLPKFGTISIPRLAKGGFVEANTPQLALIGDNKHEGEIVAPESKIAEAVASAMMQVLPYLKGANNNMAVAGSGNTRQNITLELDGQILYEVVQHYDKKNNSRSGGRS